MTLKTFTQIIKGIRKHDSKISVIYKNGIDLCNFKDEYYSNVVAPLFVETFGEDGLNWINWFIYERIDGKVSAWDENGKPICQSIKSLYDFLKTKIDNT